MPIRITGLNSGLDTEAIISALVSSYSYKTDKYKKAQTKLSWKQDAWKNLNSKIYSFYTSLDSMRFSKNYNLKTTTCSDPTKALIQAGSNAVNGTQKLNILQVAQAGYLTGGKLGDDVTTGTTLAELGYTGGDGSINLTMGDGKTTEIKVSQGTTVNDFINSLKKAGVNASYDSVNKRIFVSSKETGLANDFTLTAGDVDGTMALSKLGLCVNSDATQATYESYVKYYDADGNVLSQKVTDAIKAYQDAKSAYDTAKAQNGNLSAAYGYASAYSAMQKALEDSGLSEAERKQFTTLLNMSASERTKSVIDADGNVYKEKGTDANGNQIYSYKDADGNEKFIQRVDTHTGSDGKTYTLDKETGAYTDADGKAYKATGKKDDAGNVLYAAEDGTEITITTESTYYDATAAEEPTGLYQIKDANGKVYAQSEESGGYFMEEGGKVFRLDEANHQLIEVKKNEDGSYEDVVDGEIVSYEADAKTKLTKTVYTQGAERADVKSSSDALTDLKEAAQNNMGLADEDMAKYVDKLVSNMKAVNTYESGKDTVLGEKDDFTREKIIASIKGAYEAAEKDGKDGAEAVNALVNTFAEKIEANKKTMTDNEAVMKEHAVLADIAAMEDGDKKDAAIADFIEKVNTAKNILDNQEITADAKKIDGQDAKILLNGIEYTGSSNAFSINGLTITAQSVTGPDEKDALTITTQTDVQGMYDKIKDFFVQYNSLINEIASLYNADSAKGYEPLTDDEKEAMSESEIEKWEEKIKASLLRRDGSLDGVMNAMTSAMSKGIQIDGRNYYLSDFGIGTLGFMNAPKNQQYAYHIDGDEDDSVVAGKTDKLMAMLTSDPDKVTEFMQKLTDGLYKALDEKMQSSSLKSKYTVYNDKEMTKEYNEYTKLIKKWEEKMAQQEERYYKQFAAMESALAKINSQSSAFGNMFGA